MVITIIYFKQYQVKHPSNFEFFFKLVGVFIKKFWFRRIFLLMLALFFLWQWFFSICSFSLFSKITLFSLFLEISISFSIFFLQKSFLVLFLAEKLLAKFCKLDWKFLSVWISLESKLWRLDGVFNKLFWRIFRKSQTSVHILWCSLKSLFRRKKIYFEKIFQ